MVDFPNIAAFTAFTAGIIGGVELERNKMLEKAAKIIEKESKRVIGTYDYGWPQLKESTQEERARLGYSANEPLLRTGELRDSIGHEITESGKEAVVGSTSQIAVYQELGTSKGIPPRSFLMSAAVAKEKDVVEAVGAHLNATLLGRPPIDSTD